MKCLLQFIQDFIHMDDSLFTSVCCCFSLWQLVTFYKERNNVSYTSFLLIFLCLTFHLQKKCAQNVQSNKIDKIAQMSGL